MKLFFDKLGNRVISREIDRKGAYINENRQVWI